MTPHAITDAVSDLLWWLRHPSARRCPRCKLTWESRSMMAVSGGVCHDCASKEYR